MNKFKFLSFFALAILLLCKPNSSWSQLSLKPKLDDEIAKMAKELKTGLAGTEFKRIGVSEFGPTSGESLRLGPYLSDKLSTVLVQQGSVDVIERSKLDIILKEQSFTGTDLVNQNTAQEIGKLLGIQAFVIGSYTVLGKKMEITARLVDVSTGKVLAGASLSIKRDKNLEPLMAPLVPPTPLQLETSLLVQRRTDRGWESVQVPDGATLYTNDNLKLFFRTNDDCYVYVLLFGSSGIAQVLFPHSQISLSNRVQGNKEYFIPTGDNWFWLDEKTGTETIYVVASYEPIRDLGKLLLDMERAGQSGQSRVSQEIEKSLRGMSVSGNPSEEPYGQGTQSPSGQERDIAGVRPGAKFSFTTSDGKKIEQVSEVVTGKAKVVRRISFQHR